MFPQYQRIRTANSNAEPIYPSLFEISFVLPTIVQQKGYDPILMLENATSIDIAQLTPTVGINEQRFKYSTRAFVAMPEKTHAEFDIKFNVNEDENRSVFVYNTLRAWYDLVWNSQNGTLFYKRNMLGTIIVNWHDREGFVHRRITYQNCQILGIEGYGDLSFESVGEIVKDVTGKFVSDYWFEERIDNNNEIVPPSVLQQ